jgi:hypothetical protein
VFWSDHLLSVVLSSGAFMVFFTAGSLVSQFVDVDHSGPWRVKGECALRNTEASCPSALLMRGVGHTVPFIAGVVAFTVFMCGVSYGLILHMMTDGIL